jgi:hypothetical protein
MTEKLSQSDLFKDLRPIDKKRIDGLCDNLEVDYSGDEIWFIHAVLAQCFLPYRDPKELHWDRKNGDFSISLMAGRIEDPTTGEFRSTGLPFGAKPRLFQSYICTQALRQKSPVISVETSMSAMMKELGYEVRGGKRGTIQSFKEQITRFAACHFTIVGRGANGTRRHMKAPPIKSFDVWFPNHPEQQSLWPSEITLTDDYYYSLRDHAIPYDFRGLKGIQSNARAQDIYLWMTQRLCRVSKEKPLFMTWDMLFETFGGDDKNMRSFKSEFKKSLLAATTAYPAAKLDLEKEGVKFYASEPPIKKTKVIVQK